jgi:hypothetical protein
MSGLIFPQQGIFKAYGQEINEQRMEVMAFSQSITSSGNIFQNSEWCSSLQPGYGMR